MTVINHIITADVQAPDVFRPSYILIWFIICLNIKYQIVEYQKMNIRPAHNKENYAILCHSQHFTLWWPSILRCQNICRQTNFKVCVPYVWDRGAFQNMYELLDLRALEFSHVNKIHIFQCMGKIFCVEFQRVPLKFHTNYLTHSLKDMIFIQYWNFKSS